MPRTIAQADIDAARAARADRSYYVMKPEDSEDEFLFAAPKLPEYVRFQAMAIEDQGVALRTLCDGCVIVPTPAEFATLLIDHPGYGATLGNQLLRIAGAGIAVKVKKV